VAGGRQWHAGRRQVQQEPPPPHKLQEGYESPNHSNIDPIPHMARFLFGRLLVLRCCRCIHRLYFFMHAPIRLLPLSSSLSISPQREKKYGRHHSSYPFSPPIAVITSQLT
jgi:hypothetical protein